MIVYRLLSWLLTFNNVEGKNLAICGDDGVVYLEFNEADLMCLVTQEGQIMVAHRTSETGEFSPLQVVNTNTNELTVVDSLPAPFQNIVNQASQIESQNTFIANSPYRDFY
ncbi:hypothetical protein A0H76_3029, partial [Hepatospora eriocheir]